MAESNLIKLETARLCLIPLNLGQLLSYSKFDGSLESQLGMLPFKRASKASEDKFMFSYILAWPEHILFATIWIIILRAHNVIVGDIGFKGAPSEKGLVEIGYCTYPEFRRQGFMKEAVKCMTAWAFDQPEVQIILADTYKKNAASQRVLIQNSFEPFAETDNMFWWRLDRNKE